MPELTAIKTDHVALEELVLQNLPAIEILKCSFYRTKNFPVIALTNLPSLKPIQLTDAAACIVQDVVTT